MISPQIFGFHIIRRWFILFSAMSKFNLFLTLVIFLLLIAPSQRAQTPQANAQADKKWNDLLTALESENWVTSADLSSLYLSQAQNSIDAASAAKLRFMYLYSAAGRVSEGKQTFDDLEKQVKQFVGKDITIPFQKIRSKCERGPLFNTICAGESGNQAMITASNAAATTIHAFVYIRLKEKFDFANNDEKIGSVSGRIDSIALNPNKSLFLIMRIYISDAGISVKEAP